MQYRGIDISEYQSGIDFEKVKASGIDFVMIRTGYGRNASQSDKRMREHAAGAESAGLAYGFYHYSYALTPEAAEQEADFALSLIRGFSPTMPIAYDIEDATQKSLSRETLSRIADVFLTKIRSAGYYPILYSSLNWLNTRFTPDLLAKYDIWLAQWASAPQFVGDFGIWQYTSSGRVDGVSGSVDMNIAYRDYPALIAALEPSAPSEPVPSLDNTPDSYAKDAVDRAIAQGILRGDDTGDLMLHSPLSRQDLFVIIDRLGLLG